VIRHFLLIAAIIGATGCAAVEETKAVPALELTGRVVDGADILSQATESRLVSRLAALETSTGVQLVVATTPSLGGYLIEDYSLDLANAWGVGSAERDDGLLVLVAPNERKVRIEVGYGLEASVKDEEAALIIEQHILPHLRKGDYDLGIISAVDSLAEEVTPVTFEEAA